MDDPMGAASQPELQNIEGIVKWFDPRKGFGFLVGPQGEDIFVHYSVIQGEGFKVLKDGVNRWTDNVFALRAWLMQKMQGRTAAEIDKMLGIGADFDFIGEEGKAGAGKSAKSR